MKHAKHMTIRDQEQMGECILITICLLAGILLVSATAEGQTKPTRRTSRCTNDTCHSTLINKKNMHQPVANALCLDCHDYANPEQHLFRLTMPRRDLCGSCHTLEHQSQVHFPVADNNCIGCHDPHGSDHPLMLIADPAQGLCLTCHNQDFNDKEYVHGPVAIGACVICHQSHSSSYPGLLTKSEDQLCQDCHEEMTPQGPSARHLHKPLEEGCTTCHDAHASNHQFQLHADTPELCFTCHEGVKNHLNSAENTHGPVEEPGGCIRCHSPHFTALPKLQRRPQPDMCLDCHDQPVQAKDGRILTNMAQLLNDNPNQHGPIREGACTTCHQPHASKQFSLLFQNYPAEFYAPFKTENYALCFSCHLSDLVLDQSGFGLTNFRDGDLNLHWMHVNKEKGRTCRACHEVHASQNPFHVREAVPFGKGGWMLQLNYDKTDNGGSCAPGCHKSKSYDRISPVIPVDPKTATLGNGGPSS